MAAVPLITPAVVPAAPPGPKCPVAGPACGVTKG